MTTTASKNSTSNQGWHTELTHYRVLTDVFGTGNVSEPKNSAGGSDFVVMHKDQVITFESKTSNTDVFDAGVVNMYANGVVFHASHFLTNTHVTQVESLIERHQEEVTQYCVSAGTDRIPHRIDKTLYADIKAQGHLLHMCEPTALQDIMQHAFVQSRNRFVKAHYLCIDNAVYAVSAAHDPLRLVPRGVALLDDEAVDYTSLRTARGGSKDGQCSVCMRLQFRLKKTLPPSPIRLTELGEETISGRHK